MIKFTKNLGCAGVRDHSLPKIVMNSQKRALVVQKSELADGREVEIELSEPMKPYDVLHSEDGVDVQVVPEAEEVVCVRLSDRVVFSKICYYFGSRSIPIQILPMSFCFLPDRAIEKACRNFGLMISHEFRPFVPEAGAYAHHGPRYCDLYSLTEETEEYL